MQLGCSQRALLRAPVFLQLQPSCRCGGIPRDEHRLLWPALQARWKENKPSIAGNSPHGWLKHCCFLAAVQSEPVL